MDLLTLKVGLVAKVSVWRGGSSLFCLLFCLEVDLSEDIVLQRMSDIIGVREEETL